MKIWGAGEGFTGFSHMMTHHLNNRRRMAETFAEYKFWSVIG